MMKAACKASKQGKVANSLHDNTFTPRAAAAASMQIIDIDPTDHCLDPARGGGAFYDQFACDEDHKHYCAPAHIAGGRTRPARIGPSAQPARVRYVCSGVLLV